MGLFNRGEAITGMIAGEAPAIHAYHGEILVWDGTRQAFVSVTRTVGTAAARVPGVSASAIPDTPAAVEVDAAVLGPVLSATAIVDPDAVAVTAIVEPISVSADSLILAEVITCAAQALPAEAAEANDWNVSAVPTVVDAEVLAPGVTSNLARQPDTITVTAAVPVPVVTATGSGVVAAVTVEVSALAGTPTIGAGGRVTALVATASASANTPGIGGGATISAVTAIATAAGHAPIVSGGINPQGMQRTTAALQLTSASTYQKLTPMQAKSGYESTIVADGLVMPGSATVNLAARLEFNSSSATDRRVRIVKNGSTVLGETFSSGTHTMLTLSVNGVTLVATDTLTLEGYSAGTASTRNISESSGVTYLTVTVP